MSRERRNQGPPRQAIRTTYKGVEFRSRHEADVARYFDECNIGYEYEKRSFLLPSGIHFMPDFYLPSFDLWVEARGYHTPKSDAQIVEFPSVMPDGDAFLVCWRDDSGRRFEMRADSPTFFYQNAIDDTRDLVAVWAWEIVGAIAAFYSSIF